MRGGGVGDDGAVLIIMGINGVLERWDLLFTSVKLRWVLFIPCQNGNGHVVRPVKNNIGPLAIGPFSAFRYKLAIGLNY